MIHRSDLTRYLGGEKGTEALKKLYGTDTSLLEKQRKRWLRLASLFAEQYPDQEKIRLFSTPGRTEVGGNHTDHQHGRVLCAAVDLDIIAVAAPNSDSIIRLKSEGFPDMDIVDLRQLKPVAAEKEKSAALIRGIAASFSSRGWNIGGMDIYTTSRVPKGSGLSSSAAFEIIVATILDHLHNDARISPVERAIIAQESENRYFGKPSGLMDQCGCSVGGFIAIDFADPASPDVEPIPFDFAHSGHALVITNTGGSHADLTNDYASIPHDMKTIAAALGQTVLRTADQEAFWQNIAQIREIADDQAILRAMHFFADNERVNRQKQDLQEGRFEGFLQNVRASGTSSWTLLQNVYSASSPRQQPVAAGLAVSGHILGGRGACRVHGGGFAGTIQAYVPEDLVDPYMIEMEKLFGSGSARLTQIRSVGSTELLLN